MDENHSPKSEESQLAMKNDEIECTDFIQPLRQPEATVVVNEALLPEPAEEQRVNSFKRALQTYFKCCSDPFLTSRHPLPSDPTRCDRLLYSVRCPPHGVIAELIFKVSLIGLLIGFVWGAHRPLATPGGLALGLIVLFVFSSIAGRLAGLIRLPPLIGMLAAGFALGNTPSMKAVIVIAPKWSTTIRSIALVIILTRAGLGLDPVALRRLKGVVIRLAFMPCTMEAVAVAVASHLLLGFRWEFAFILGFALAAVSPAVIVPSMLRLQEKQLGTEQGIPTLVIASSSLDDVLAIGVHAVLLGVAFSQGGLAWKILQGPVELVIGLTYGILFGMTLWYIPASRKRQVSQQRFVLLFVAGLFAMFASRGVHLSGAGAPACLVLAFVAGIGWRDNAAPKGADAVGHLFAFWWQLFQPFLFGLIGYEVNIASIEPKTVAIGIGVLAIGLFIRSLTVLLATFGGGFSIRERIFVALAWLPKATVQAAIGSLAMDMAREAGLVDETEVGLQILTIAVLSIVITAPLGSAAIEISSGRLLRKAVPVGHDKTNVT